MNDRRPPSLDRRTRLAIALGGVVLRLLAATWRMRARNAEIIARHRRAGRPFVIALWHGQQLPMLWQHRGEGIRILISEHRDGEIIARVAESLGCGTIRGSTTRGGTRALLQAIHAVEEGAEIAITPDGPRGPAHAFAPGAIVVSAKTGAPIVAAVVHASRAWRLSSWDGFIIPKPFARITVAYAEGVATGLKGPALEADVVRFAGLMAEADALARA